MKVRNIRQSADPYEIAATGQVVGHGETVDVDDLLGLSLCEQHEAWAPGDDAAVSLFVEFCRWVEAVQALTPAVPEVVPFVPIELLPNPGLAALAAPPTVGKKSKPSDTAGVTSSTEEG